MHERAVIERNQKAQSLVDIYTTDFQSPLQRVGLAGGDWRLRLAFFSGVCSVVGCVVGFILLRARQARPRLRLCALARYQAITNEWRRSSLPTPKWSKTDLSSKGASRRACFAPCFSRCFFLPKKMQICGYVVMPDKIAFMKSGTSTTNGRLERAFRSFARMDTTSGILDAMFQKIARSRATTLNF